MNTHRKRLARPIDTCEDGRLPCNRNPIKVTVTQHMTYVLWGFKDEWCIFKVVEAQENSL